MVPKITALDLSYSIKKNGSTFLSSFFHLRYFQIASPTISPFHLITFF